MDYLISADCLVEHLSMKFQKNRKGKTQLSLVFERIYGKGVQDLDVDFKHVNNAINHQATSHFLVN